MNKAYNRINWENYPSDSTPLNEDNLNKMDIAINEVDNRVISLDTTKLPVATAYTMVKDVEFDEKTGVFTITKLNGSVIKIDTALEKISTNFRFDHSTQKLILTLIDGTTQEVDLSALLTQYEFTDSDTIAFTIDTSGKVVASVKKGSITQDMLEPNYLANIKVEVAKAESASLSADTSAKNAKTSETNAKTSEEKAREYAEAAGGIDTLISSFATGTNPTIQDSTNAPIISQTIKGYTVQDGTPTPDTPVEIESLGELQEDGSYKVAVKTCGKNLLKNTVTTKTSNGVTFTVNEDGSVTVNGTATTDTQLTLNSNLVLQAGKYILSGCPTNGSPSTYRMWANNTTTGENLTEYGKGVSFTVKKETRFIIPIKIHTGVTATNLTFYPMIRPAEIEDATYEPYTETTAEFDLSEPLYEGDYIEIYADGSGKLFRAMAEVVFDGSDDELWNKSDSQTGNFYMLFTAFDAVCKPKIKDNITKEPFCSHLKYATYGLDFAIGNITVSNAAIHLWITDGSEISDIDEYKAWLAENPITVVYELATPTEIELTDEELEQFKNLRTFETVTNIICDGETETTYYKATDNGEVVSALHEKVDSTNKSIESLNESLKETDTVVGGAVGANGDTNVSYTDIQDIAPDGNVYFSQVNGGSLVNGLKNATSQIRGMFASLKYVFSLKTHNHDDTYVKKEEFTVFKYLKTVYLVNYAELGPEYRAKVGQLGFDRYMFNLRATQTYDYSEHDVDIMNIIKPANEPVMKHIPPVMGLNSSYTSIVSFFSGVVYISDGDVEFVLSIDAGGTNPKVPSDYRVDIYGAM